MTSKVFRCFKLTLCRILLRDILQVQRDFQKDGDTHTVHPYIILVGTFVSGLFPTVTEINATHLYPLLTGFVRSFCFHYRVMCLF